MLGHQSKIENENLLQMFRCAQCTGHGSSVAKFFASTAWQQQHHRKRHGGGAGAAVSPLKMSM